MSSDDEFWFEQKRYGIGAGLPIAPQGWLVLAAYIVVLGLCGVMIDWTNAMEAIVGVVILVSATVGLSMIAKARTRGGWAPVGAPLGWSGKVIDRCRPATAKSKDIQYNIES